MIKKIFKSGYSKRLHSVFFFGCILVSMLLFLLARASDRSDFFYRYYPALLSITVVIIIGLLCLMGCLLIRLYRRQQRGEFGSQLMGKLIFFFTLMGILPGTLVYLVSIQFVSHSIESWFDARVESALEAGLNISRTALETALSDFKQRTVDIAAELSELSNSERILHLSRLQNIKVDLVGNNGRIVASVSNALGKILEPMVPLNPVILQQARRTQGYAVIEKDPDNMVSEVLRLRVIVGIPPPPYLSLTTPTELVFLQASQAVLPYLAHNAQAVREAYGQYQERSRRRLSLKKNYIMTLSLSLFLAILGAMISAFLIATDLVKPLLLLSEGTKAVAQGDFSPKPIVSSTDELGVLTQSFHKMTQQLAEARETVELNRAELQSAKAHLESVLENMSAGVIVLDKHFHLMAYNPSVERILHCDFGQFMHKPLTFIHVSHLNPFLETITQAFSARTDDSFKEHWQHPIELKRHPRVSTRRSSPNHPEEPITLLARGSRLPNNLSNHQGSDYVVVFDDISDIISGQRSIAWGEVARRLAHEIKNPLTPIQLSAERLKMKLETKLPPAEVALLKKSTETIIQQVTAMKRMVDDFRHYSNIPPSAMSVVDLNALILDILHLYTLTNDENNPQIIHTSLAPNLPKVLADETQLRQVIHNLIQNAQYAVNEYLMDAIDLDPLFASSQGQQESGHISGNHTTPKPLFCIPRIDIVTESIIYKASDTPPRFVARLSITDNGPGFSENMLACAFEPYITSKPQGTGLGLPMVKKILDQHGALIQLHNRTETHGAKIVILLLKLAQDNIIA